MVTSDIGPRVRRLRDQTGWTQEQLAIQASRRGSQRVSRGWLSQVESGEIDKPRADLLNQVALALGATLDYLMNGPAPDGSVQITVPEANASRLSRLSDTAGDILDDVEDFIARLHLRQQRAQQDTDQEHQ